MKLSNYWVGASGLSAAQNAMQVAQQNITNLNTSGYVRQSVVLQSNHTGGIVGNGVLTTGIERIINDAISRQYNSQLATVSYYGYQADMLARAESLVGTNTLSTALNNFYDVWSQIYHNPMDTNGLNSLISEIGSLTSQINQLTSGLEGMQSQLRSDLDVQVSEVNNLLSQIANINEQIMSSGRNTPNGLLDQRDALISELSQYVPVEVSYDSGNTNVVTVRINGLIGVDGETFHHLGVETDSMTGAVTGFTLNDRRTQLQTGVLQATLDTGKYIDNYQEQLSDFVNNFAGTYHSILDDVLSDILRGESFFLVSPKGHIELNPIVSENVGEIQNRLIDEEILAGIVGLQKTSNLLGQLDKLTLTVASDVSKVNTSLKANYSLFEALESMKSSIEGVNLDEELITITALQNYYAANSKTIDATNKMFDMILALL